MAVKYSIVAGVGKYWLGLAKEKLLLVWGYCMETLLGCYFCYMVAIHWQVWSQGHEDRQKASLYAKTTHFRLCSLSSGNKCWDMQAPSFSCLPQGTSHLECSSLRTFFLNLRTYPFIISSHKHGYMYIWVCVCFGMSTWHYMQPDVCLSVYNLCTYLFNLHFDNSPLHPFPNPIERTLLPIFMSFCLWPTALN